MLKTILVIEEQAQIRNLFIESLTFKGFRAIGAENGRVGLQQAREHLPDLIVCELIISELDGYGVLSAVRQHHSTMAIPFIFVTVKTSRTDQRKAMERGANDYLTKPCTIQELLGAIAAQIDRQIALRQWYETQFQLALKSEPPPANLETAIATPEPICSFEPPLREALRFIEMNYHRSISLSDVSHAVDYSPAYLTNLMKCRTGQTVQRWIIKYRMAAASSLLLNTNLAVEQIAAQVGYQHSVHFFRQFRQFHSMTPQAWRNAHATDLKKASGE